MSRLSTAFLGTAAVTALALALIQVQVAGPEPMARSVHELAPSGMVHDGH